MSTDAPMPADTLRARRLRLFGILLLAAGVAAASWFSLRSGRKADAPEGVFDYVRDRCLAGDGEAMWREMTYKARQDYVKFLQIMDRPRDGEGTIFEPAEWRRKMGLSAEEVRNLPPEKVLAKENLASAEEFFRGARVYQVDRIDEDRAYLKITLRTGHDRFWLVRKVDGAWRIDELWSKMTEEGNVVQRPGQDPREAPANRPERGTVRSPK